LTLTKYRIPRATTAALLLGGAACGGDDGSPGGSAEGTNVSSSRISAVVKALCKQYQECYSDDFDEYYDSQADCVEEMKTGFESGQNKKCTDAALDYIACYSQLSCRDLDAALEEKCGDLGEAYDDACEDEDGLTDSDSATKRIEVSLARGAARFDRAHAVVQKFRIPR
jgi:hypothetical protein